MTERPILFSGAMVRAILDGRKTQTRRVIKPQPSVNVVRKSDCVDTEKDYPREYWIDRSQAFTMPPVPNAPGDVYQMPSLPIRLFCPYGQPGDRLWVRETWLELDRDGWFHPSEPKDELIDVMYPRRNGCAYAANTDAEGNQIRKEYGYKWKPSIHMPRWASRLNLEIVSVRVERIQQITTGGLMQKSDVQKEGCPFRNDPAKMGEDEGEWFIGLWDSINAKRGFGFDSNPWVWVVEFKRA